MGIPADFYQNADECIELAKSTTNEVHQKMLLGLAAQWMELAVAKRRERDSPDVISVPNIP